MLGKPTPQVSLDLVRFETKDFDRLISWLPTEDDLVEWCAAFFRHPLTHAQLESYLQSAKQLHVREIFTVWTDEGEAVGHIEISQIWPHLSSRLSRVLVAPHKRRRGLARSMISQALTRTFDEHRVDHVDLGVSANNVAAIGCYEKLGFAHVDIWPDAISVGRPPRTIDVLWMTLRRQRWIASSGGG